MRQILPRAVTVFEHVLTAREWAALESAGQVALASKHRKTLQDAINEFRLATEVSRASARPAAVRPILQALSDSLDQAGKILREMISDASAPAVAFEAMRRANQRGTTLRYYGPEYAERAERIATEIEFLRQDAAAALGRLPSESNASKGAPSNLGRPELLIAAHAVFADAGGDGIYTQPSLEFLKRVCVIAGCSTESMLTLGAVKEAVRSARKAIGE